MSSDSTTGSRPLIPQVQGVRLNHVLFVRKTTPAML
jgi:hypothetical protein